MRVSDTSRAAALLLLAVVAVAGMIFGDLTGLGIGLFVLWFLSTMVIPAVFWDALTRRFGETWGTLLAFAPLWLPLLLALISFFFFRA